MKLLHVPLLAIALAAGCTTPADLAYVNGSRWSRVEKNTYDTRIVSVDGVTRGWNEKLLVSPGVRTIVLEAPPAAGFSRVQEQTLIVNIDPCMQYWFEAKRINPLAQAFEPRVNHRESIAGCRLASG